MLKVRDWREKRDWRRIWRDRAGLGRFYPCGCCGGGPAAQSTRPFGCVQTCCAGVDILPTPLVWTFGPQLLTGCGCVPATTVTPIDNLSVSLAFVGLITTPGEVRCKWVGHFVCGTGNPPIPSIPTADGTNYLTVLCCIPPQCPSIRWAALWTIAYGANSNVLYGTNYNFSSVLTGTCSPLNITGLFAPTGNANKAVCDQCNNTSCAPRWNVTVTQP